MFGSFPLEMLDSRWSAEKGKEASGNTGDTIIPKSIHDEDYEIQLFQRLHHHNPGGWSVVVSPAMLITSSKLTESFWLSLFKPPYYMTIRMNQIIPGRVHLLNMRMTEANSNEIRRNCRDSAWFYWNNSNSVKP